MGKPVIGVTPLWDEEKKSVWMLPEYLDGVIEAGGVPFVFPFLTKEQTREMELLAQRCDGFLFTGGPDISPEFYQETPLEGLVKICGKRDELESCVLKMALREEKPVLGICRGIQLINAVLGGSLYQDLPSQHPSQTAHRQKAPYHAPSHEVKILRDTPLYRCLGTETLSVNSLHHQAVKKTAPDLEAMAVSEDGITEAVYMPSYRFLWAVQWHPEYSFQTDPASRKIFEAFIASMM